MSTCSLLSSPFVGVMVLQLTFADGTVYAGQFVNGINTGLGVLTFPDKV
jgi:hypothetical protein